MLTALEIENFKGMAGRQRIEFAPLTLLFGANSAGKSTILQALLYLHELIVRGSADVDRTELGGNALELGGFARLVHKHDTERAIVLRAEFATPKDLESFARNPSAIPFPDLSDELSAVWIEVRVRHRAESAFSGAIVDRIVIGVPGVDSELVCIEPHGSLRDAEPSLVRINLGHPLIEAAALEIKEDWRTIAVPNGVRNEAARDGDGQLGFRIHSNDGTGFGDLRSLFTFFVAHDRRGALPDPKGTIRVVPFSDEDPSAEPVAEQIRAFLEMVALGSLAQLSAYLHDSLYIGPLRAIPQRGFLYERSSRVTSWADGLGAWDRLLADRLTLVEQTNALLDVLGTGCRIVVQQLAALDATGEEIATNNVDKTLRRLLLDMGTGSLVLPSEVGAGISQVVPVVVASLEGSAGLTLIEQPELHVHPAVQVGLGDLLIRAVTREGSKRSLLIETHSEHLILRLLRRIRETTENELADDAPAFSKEKLSVLYIESMLDGVRVRRLRVDENGEFVDRWPKGFFAERMEELL